MRTNERRPGRRTEAAESLAATASLPDTHDNTRQTPAPRAGIGPELLDSLDRTDLLWFARRPGVTARTRPTRPAEATHLAATYGVRPRRVTVRRLAPGILARDYGAAGTVLAFVAAPIVREATP